MAGKLKDRVIYVRADAALINGVDRLTRHLAKTRPGMGTSRSDVVRWLIKQAIANHEKRGVTDG